jgi:RNA polymerase sigma-70 factor (ECF subfamily)
MSAEISQTDGVLLLQMAEEDEAAFTALYRRYWEQLFVTAAKVLRGKEEASDVVQDVFLSLWNRRRELVITGSVAAYLQTSVRYKAIHYIEKNIIRRDYLALLTDTAVNIMPTPETQLQLKEVQAVIQNIVTQMPPKMREVYQLSRQQHLTHNEIAARLGISAETVKKHIQHALQLIKTALGHHLISIGIVLTQIVIIKKY